MKLAHGNWECELATSLPARITLRQRGKANGSYHLLREPYCKRCASNGKTTSRCTWHYKFHPLLSRVYAVGVYHPPPRTNVMKGDVLSEHIWALKFGSRDYASPIGASMALVVKRLYPELMGYDVLVPIPRFAGSPSEKGYDHAEEIAKVVSEVLGKSCEQFLRKVKNEKMVDKPTMDDRWASGMNLYELNPGFSAKDKKIILVDDICTSGSTLSGAAGVLSELGAAANVVALVAGRSYDRNFPLSRTG